MSFFVCGNCGHEAHVFGQGGAARAAAETSTEVLGQVHLRGRPRAAAAALTGLGTAPLLLLAPLIQTCFLWARGTLRALWFCIRSLL